MSTQTRSLTRGSDQWENPPRVDNNATNLETLQHLAQPTEVVDLTNPFTFDGVFDFPYAPNAACVQEMGQAGLIAPYPSAALDALIGPGLPVTLGETGVPIQTAFYQP
jgi:hypothetical protein